MYLTHVRCLFLNLSLSLTLILASPLVAADDPYVIPLRPDPPIAIDGDLADWVAVPNPIQIDDRRQVTLNATSWHGTGDLRAAGHMAWRQEGLYIALDITDDVVAQTQRAGSLYRGDHVEVFLDRAPDAEPDRGSFGAGQFQFAFSPGNFQQTGDPLVDIKPEVHCYQPRGGTTKGIKYTAVRTPGGWRMEAMIPFRLLGMTPRSNMPLACEVALSDCDSAEPAQETFMTIGTKPWVYSRRRLPLMALGNARGGATLPATVVHLEKSLLLPAGTARELVFATPSVPEGKDVYLFFRARVVAGRPAGYTRALRLRLNGHAVAGTRLGNRPMQSMRRAGIKAVIVTPDGIINVPYSPDYTSYDRDESYGLVGGVKANEFAFRLGGLLAKDGNTLTLQSLTDKHSKRDVVLGDIELRIQPRPRPPKPRAPAPTGPLPVIAPKRLLQTEFSVDRQSPTRLAVRVANERFVIESRFSSPDGTWNRGGSAFFSHRRRIEQNPEYIVVFDTLKNLTDKDIPVMQRHTCDLRGRMQRAWIAGISPQSNNMTAAEPANPSSYGTTSTAGLGLLPLNDQFQVHVVNSALDGVLGLADNTFVLGGGRTYTAEWIVVPTAKPDFWAFVNAARRARDVNFTLPYQFAFLSAGPRTAAWRDAVLADFIRNKSANLVCASIGYPRYHGMYSHGTAFQHVDVSAYARHNQRVHRLVPGTKAAVYFHCFIDVLENAPSVYAAARLLRSNGEQAVYGKPYDRIFVPTLNNKFGHAVAKNIDLILGPCKADGVYWDELAYSRYRYHYGPPWDGCSGDIDPRSFQLQRRKSSVTLLSLPFRRHHVDRIMERGPFIANGQPHTRTMARLKYQCFVETASISNCMKAVLYSPIALGDHITERTLGDAYRWMVDALNFGCVYNWYSDVVAPEHSTLAAYMFPITPIELHEGYIVGRERIVTNRSGLFGWGDDSAHEVHTFDERGRAVEDFKAPLRIIDGQTYTELRIAEGWSAAIVRGTHHSHQ